jgi:hypothetical protein
MNAYHISGAVDHGMRDAFEGASAYRAKNGKWPATLEEMPEVGHLHPSYDPLNQESNKPYYYNPQAKPGTTDILIGRPIPFDIGLWPFNKSWQHAITADGKIVDLPPGGE